MRSTSSDATELIRDLIGQTGRLIWGNEGELDLILKRAEMVTRRLFGETHQHRRELKEITFPPRHLSETEDYLDDWALSETKLLNTLKVMLEELEVFGVPTSKDLLQYPTFLRENQVLVAHGHDEGMREATARTLEKLGLVPIVLQEQLRESRTVAEQLEHYSNVQYAVVLFSPDDMAYTRSASPSEARLRARQNVVDEFGYFKGKLGRENIFVLYRKTQGFEFPSNMDGVLYVPYDGLGHWKIELARELQKRGYEPDLDKLIPSHPESIGLNS